MVFKSDWILPAQDAGGGGEEESFMGGPGGPGGPSMKYKIL